MLVRHKQFLFIFEQNMAQILLLIQNNVKCITVVYCCMYFNKIKCVCAENSNLMQWLFYEIDLHVQINSVKLS